MRARPDVKSSVFVIGEPAGRLGHDLEAVLRLADRTHPGGQAVGTRIVAESGGGGKHSRARSFDSTRPRGSIAYVATFDRRIDSIMSIEREVVVRLPAATTVSPSRPPAA